MTRRLLPLALLGAALLTAASAQPSRTLPDDPWCQSAGYTDADRVRACEVRETLTAAARLDLDGQPNGSVHVTRWDRDDVLVRAVVVAYAPDEAAAREVLGGVRVRVDGGDVRAQAPVGGWYLDGRFASVSFDVFAPRDTDVVVQTTNGAVRVDGIRGDVEVRSLNGAVALAGVGGGVRVRAVNGAVRVDLDERWDGRGLDVETTNGAVVLGLAPEFSGELSARTRVGRIGLSGLDNVAHLDRQRGRWMGDRVTARLGTGGPRVTVATTNGGISIRQSR